MRFLMFLVVVSVVVGFQALHCKEVVGSQTEIDTPHTPGDKMSSDKVAGHIKTYKKSGRLCGCNGGNRSTGLCPCNAQPPRKLSAEEKLLCWKKNKSTYKKCLKYLNQKKKTVSTPI